MWDGPAAAADACPAGTDSPKSAPGPAHACIRVVCLSRAIAAACRGRPRALREWVLIQRHYCLVLARKGPVMLNSPEESPTLPFRVRPVPAGSSVGSVDQAKSAGGSESVAESEVSCQ